MLFLIDFDGTALEWGGNWDTHLDKNPKLVNVKRSKDQTSFDLWVDLTDEERVEVMKIMNYPGYYAELEPIPGVVTAYHEMIDEGHEVMFVTSPWIGNASCLQDKQDSAVKHFGKDAADRLILTRDKTLIKGDILIDDKPDISGRVTPEWEHVYFTQPYNIARTDKRRIGNWTDWRDLLPENETGTE